MNITPHTKKIFYSILTVLIYSIIFLPAIKLTGHIAYTFLFLPLIVICWFVGKKGSLLVLVSIILLNILLSITLPQFHFSDFIAACPFHLTTLIVGYGVGWVSDLYVKTKTQTELLQKEKESLNEEIRKREKIEHSLRKSEEKYSYLIANVKEIIFQTDVKGRWTFLNSAWEEISGFSVEESLGKFFLLFVHPEDRKNTLEEFQFFIRVKKDFFRYFVRGLTKTGTTIWVEVQARASFDERQNINGAIGVIKDVTELKLAEDQIKQFTKELEQRIFERTSQLVIVNRKLRNEIEERTKTEEELRKSEERYRELFENNPNPMWVYDLDTLEFIAVNEAAVRHYGYSKNEFLSMNLTDIRPQEDVPQLLENVRTRREIFQNSGVWRHKKKDGTIILVEITSHLLSETEGKKRRLVLVNDITEQKLAEEALRTERSQLLSIFSSIDEVVYVADMDTYEILYANEIVKKMFGKNVVGKICYKEFQDKDAPCDFCTNAIIKETKYQPYYWEFHNPKVNCTYQIVDRVIKWTDGRDVRFELAIDITDKKKAEQILRESEERYRALIKNLPNFVLVHIGGKIVYINDIAVEAGGYSYNELIGESIFKFIVPKYYEATLDRMEKHAKGEDVGEYEIEVIYKNGERRDMIVKDSLITYNNENAVLVVLTDITERKKTQAALEESERRYRNIFESSPIGIYRTTPSGKILLANPALINMLEFSSLEELKKINLEKHSYAKDYTRKDFIEKIERNGKVVGYESAWYKSDNSIVYVRENATAIKDAEGNTLYYEGTVENITEQKAVQEELQKYRLHLEDLVEKRTLEIELSEERFRTLAENSYDTIIRFNSNLEHVYINPIIKERTGIPPEKYIGRTIREIGFPLHLTNYWESMLLKVFETKELNRIEMELPNHYWVDWLMLPEFDKNGNVSTIIVVGRDITERKKLEESIKEALEKEKELNEMKSRFISTASHEFRTPLTTVLSSAELLERYGRKWSEEKYSDHITRIRSSVDYLTQLINDVLTISRTETGKIEFNPQEIDFCSLCHTIIKEIKPIATDKHRIIFNYKTYRKNFILDEKLLRFILLNLLSNAIKYSPDGGNVDLEINVQKKYLVIKISDKGIGISEADQKMLFEPFYRGSNIQNIPGTGLGLSIVKKSVELHSGRIEIKNRAGNGTTFIVHIPALD